MQTEVAPKQAVIQASGTDSLRHCTGSSLMRISGGLSKVYGVVFLHTPFGRYFTSKLEDCSHPKLKRGAHRGGSNIVPRVRGCSSGRPGRRAGR